MNLAGDHQVELNRYLNHFRAKKDGVIKEVDLALNEFREDNVQDSIFNREDVEAMMDKLKEEMRKVLDQEITNLVRVSGIYVQTVLTEAEKSQVNIKIDMNLIENNTAIENIKKFESKNVKDIEVTKTSKSMGAKLPTLSGGSEDAAKKIQELEAEVASLKQRNQDLQVDLIKLTKEKSSNVQTFSLRTEGDYAEEIHDLKTKMKEYEVMIQEMKEELNKKMNDSVQFNNLKKLMQQRNEQIKTLRERLSKYETVE